MTLMVQFSATGKFVRRARFDRVLWALWARQLPSAQIQLVIA